ncbi:hypothetical protein HMPREF0299_7281 [Corynebacterium matruchotii ATCC 14266]|uniref:Uncharacterized protein n=1 Tax=Corynebacterium matruchotii ATCC 14266 TaxID=553207 RepID=E0DE86_9CORY|nr:hypothetical protein HMPREF0299_7281 [Corynebacterium matruchotii ATCC 14266]
MQSSMVGEISGMGIIAPIGIDSQRYRIVCPWNISFAIPNRIMLW